MSTEVQTKVQASPAQNFTPVQTGLLQKKCALCNTPGLVGDSERDKEKLTLQRSPVDQAGTTTVPRFGHDFNRVNVHSTGSGMIQTKLKINEPGDLYEQEADRVAEQVMRMPEPRVQKQPEEELVQKKSLITPLIQKQSEEEEDEEEEFLQTKELPGQSSEVTPALSSSIQSLRGGGQPLPESTRAYFEPRFGYDFSKVRVHTDARAVEAVQAMNAQAFTVGRDVVFGAGQYAPQTSTGLQLLAHELTHTLQRYNQIRCKRPGLKISKVRSSHDANDAKIKAREFAEIIKTGKWGDENSEQLEYWLQFFEGSALSAFILELNEVLGDKFTEFEGKSKAHEIIYAAVTETSMVIPISRPEVVRGGFKVGYSAQIFKETSESTFVEVYSDKSGGIGIGVEIPIKKIVKIKFAGDWKFGRKEGEKEEEKKASRIGEKISRTFTVQKLERKVFKYEYLKTYHDVSAGPEPELASRVTREMRGFQPNEIQVGYQIVPDQGGKLWGPFWNVYEEGWRKVEGSALVQVWEVLQNEHRKIAENLVFGED
ncbi:MAG: DUF4157 domain-containing protein [Gammaproteobacteria bacterium]|nr:DUF4157 domain-containing protein [Gammaproteobacteria bacterium]